MNAIETLEHEAIQAHARGDTWRQFHANHGPAILKVEPCDHRRHHRMLRRLMALVVSGDCDGLDPIGDAIQPWEQDAEQQSPHDTQTQARCLLP